MAPELLNDSDNTYNLQSDIWSFGCLIFFIRTGIELFYDSKNDKNAASL